MKRLTPIALAVCVLLASQLVAAENASIEGIWTMTSMKIKGKERSRNPDNSFTVSDGKCIVRVGMTKIPGTYKLNDTQTPKHIDMIANVEGREFLSLSIYKIEGNTLMICKGTRDARPTAFDSEQGTLITYKRKK